MCTNIANYFFKLIKTLKNTNNPVLQKFQIPNMSQHFKKKRTGGQQAGLCLLSELSALLIGASWYSAESGS